MEKRQPINFLDTDIILDRLESEARNAGLSLNELWDRIELEERTLRKWRLGDHAPSLASLQHVQKVINDYISERSTSGVNDVA